MQSIRSALTGMGIGSSGGPTGAQPTAGGTGAGGTALTFPYRAETTILNLRINNLPPELLARGKFEPYLSIRRNDEVKSVHRTWTKKDYGMGTDIVYNESYSIDCGPSDFIKVILYNDSPLFRPDQALAEANVPVRELTSALNTMREIPVPLFLVSDWEAHSHGASAPGTATTGTASSGGGLIGKITSHLPGRHRATSGGAAGETAAAGAAPGTTGVGGTGVVGTQVGIVNLRIQLLQSPAAAAQMTQGQQAAGVAGAAPIAGAAPLAGVPVAGTGMPVAGTGMPVAGGSVPAAGGGGSGGMGTGAALGAGALGGAALGAGAYAAASHAGAGGGGGSGGMMGGQLQQPGGVVPVAVIPPGGTSATSMGAGGVGGGGVPVGGVAGAPAGSGLAPTQPLAIVVDNAVVDFSALSRLYGYSVPSTLGGGGGGGGGITGGLTGAMGTLTGSRFEPYVIARVNDSAINQQQTRTVSTSGAGGAITFNDTLRFGAVRGTDVITFFLADDNTFWKDRYIGFAQLNASDLLGQQQVLQQPATFGAAPLAGSGMGGTGVGAGGLGGISGGVAPLAAGGGLPTTGSGISSGVGGMGGAGVRELTLQGLDPKHNRTMALPAGGLTGIGQIGILRIRPITGASAAGAPAAGGVPVAGALPMAGQQQPLLTQQQQVLPPAQSLASGTTTSGIGGGGIVGSGLDQGGVPGSKLGMVGQVQSATDTGVTAPKSFVESGTVLGQGQDPSSVRRY